MLRSEKGGQMKLFSILSNYKSDIIPRRFFIKLKDAATMWYIEKCLEVRLGRRTIHISLPFTRTEL